VALTSLLLGAGACSPPPDAPTELDELSAYLFAHFEDDDDRVMPDGLANLDAFFADVDLGLDWADLAYGLDPLTEDDSADVDHPDRDPEGQLPVGLVFQSVHDHADQATVIVLADQSPVEPNSPDTYDRTFMDDGGAALDPGCFTDRGCLVLRTMNDIVKDNLLMTIPYEMHKDFKWIEIGEPGSGQWAIAARSWCEDEAVGEQDNVEINQSFSIDVFLPGDGGAVRYMALWSESTIPGTDDATIEGTIKYGMHQIFDATEDYLDDNL
jgi:hypothetical protein